MTMLVWCRALGAVVVGVATSSLPALRHYYEVGIKTVLHMIYIKRPFYIGSCTKLILFLQTF